MLTFNECVDLFSKAKNNRRRLAGNTYLHKINDKTFEILFYSTPIVTIGKNGTWKLNSGGMKTLTTKRRLNTYAPANIFQEKFVWFIEPKIEFEDGMVVDKTGCLVTKFCLGCQCPMYDKNEICRECCQ